LRRRERKRRAQFEILFRYFSLWTETKNTDSKQGFGGKARRKEISKFKDNIKIDFREIRWGVWT
jgi:hypothetical protein